MPALIMPYGGKYPRIAPDAFIAPTAVIIGDDPASQIYVRNKARACAAAGIGREMK